MAKLWTLRRMAGATGLSAAGVLNIERGAQCSDLTRAKILHALPDFDRVVATHLRGRR